MDREMEMKRNNAAAEPAIGIPYAYPQGVVASNASAYSPAAPQAMVAPPQQQFIGGSVPPNAIVGHPDGVLSLETIYGDTPAPFICPHCSVAGLTKVKPRMSLATCVACLISGAVCFLWPGCDCLWHKEHYCPSCLVKVAEFNKSDPCAVVDPMQWVQPSFAIPA